MERNFVFQIDVNVYNVKIVVAMNSFQVSLNYRKLPSLPTKVNAGESKRNSAKNASSGDTAQAEDLF